MTTTTPSTRQPSGSPASSSETDGRRRPAVAGFGGTFGIVREIFAHRQLLDLLIRRDLKSRYKDSALGFVWTLIRPLTQLVIYYFVIGQILGAARSIPEFAIYVFSGLTVYGLFSEIVAAPPPRSSANAGLIKKVYLPREIFPLASVGSALFNFAHPARRPARRHRSSSARSRCTLEPALLLPVGRCSCWSTARPSACCSPR